MAEFPDRLRFDLDPPVEYVRLDRYVALQEQVAELKRLLAAAYRQLDNQIK